MPIQLKPKKRIESAALPGVAFTVRRLSQIRRAERDLSILEAHVRASRLRQEWRSPELMDIEGKDLTADGAMAAHLAARSAVLTSAQRARAAEINAEFDLLDAIHQKPATVRAGIVSIEGVVDAEGLAIETADKLLACDTSELDALIDEMYEACKSASGLDARETKNSPSPTTGEGLATSEPAATE